MIECNAVTIELPALVTGELSDADSAHLEDHLLTCEQCRRELLELRKVIGLVSRAPLEHQPPDHLEGDVFALLGLDPVAQAVRRAPLEHEPPVLLEHKSMERAGVVRPGPTRWQRASSYLAPALAACLLIVGFLALSGDDEPGETVTDLTFVAPPTDRPWPEVEGAVTERPDGTFAVWVNFEDYPEVSGDEYCRLELVSEDGERTTVATFQISEENTDSWTVDWPLPGDPRDFESFEMSVEDRSTGEAHLILEAPIQV
ncbi:MAG: anti-sigma factor family protein [Actinomycetota bacterium]